MRDRAHLPRPAASLAVAAFACGLVATLAAAQPLPSWNDGPAKRAIVRFVADATTHTVYMTAHGFEPALLQVQPGSVVEFVNLDLAEHGARSGSAWESGVLAPGGRFQVKLAAAGTFTYADVANALDQGVIVVDSSAANKLFLPVVTR